MTETTKWKFIVDPSYMDHPISENSEDYGLKIERFGKGPLVGNYTLSSLEQSLQGHKIIGQIKENGVNL